VEKMASLFWRAKGDRSCLQAAMIVDSTAMENTMHKRDSRVKGDQEGGGLGRGMVNSEDEQGDEIISAQQSSEMEHAVVSRRESKSVL